MPPEPESEVEAGAASSGEFEASSQTSLGSQEFFQLFPQRLRAVELEGVDPEQGGAGDVLEAVIHEKRLLGFGAQGGQGRAVGALFGFAMAGSAGGDQSIEEGHGRIG